MREQKLRSDFPTAFPRLSNRADRYRGLCACGEHTWAVLTKGFVTFVSPEDAHLLQERKWYAHHAAAPVVSLVYARAAGPHRKATRRWLHREILGDIAGLEIDHKDHNGTNNRRANLRYGSHSHNLGNARYLSGGSGFRGVSFDKPTGRWVAKIARRGLGRFDTPEEAARAYDAAAIVRFGEFATLNFPQIGAQQNEVEWK